jgi:hypothetical protein
MKQLFFILFNLTLACNVLTAQTYKKGNTTLAIFTINDSLKYFEFYTQEFIHENAQIGILLKSSEDKYSLQYTNGPFFSEFNMLFKDSTLRVLDIKKEGWIAFDLKNIFFLHDNQPEKNVLKFHLNSPIFYKTKNKMTLKVYEYPCFESKTTQFSFDKGIKIEEKWSVGLYNKYKPIKDKTWIAAVCGSRFLGWLLLSDVDASFEKIE